MRIVPDSLTTAWTGNTHIGDERAFARVTVQQTRVTLFSMLMAAANVDFKDNETTKVPLYNIFSSLRFPASLANPEIEYPNVKSVQWSRTISQDVSTGTVMLYNLRAPDSDSDPEPRLDRPGYYTFYPHAVAGVDPIVPATDLPGDPGTSTFARLLCPDNILRTYEGYGFDAGLAPNEDPNLVLTGTWIIDSVAYTHDGQITVAVSDLARVLRDQICFPPVIPTDFYPVQFQALPANWDQPTPQTPNDPATGTSSPPPPPAPPPGPPVPVHIAWEVSSDNHFGFPDGGVPGHHGFNAFDDRLDTYWLSAGYTNPDTMCPPWIQCVVNPAGESSPDWKGGTLQPCDITSVDISTLHGGSRIYVSMMNKDGDWIYGGGDTNRVIPYDTTGGTAVPGSKIPYITFTDEGVSGGSDPEGSPHSLKTTFATPVQDVIRIRFTIHHLHGHGEPTSVANRYHGDATQLKAYTPGPPAPSAPPPTDVSGNSYLDTQQFDISGGAGRNPGYYGDYTDIVKLFCAWGGFYWPGTDLTDAQDADLQALRDVFTTALSNIALYQGRILGRTTTNGSTDASAFVPIIVASTPTFSSSDVGAQLTLAGAGAMGGPLVGTIVAFIDSTHVRIDTAASVSVSGAPMTIRDINPSSKYSADDAALHTWINNANTAQTNLLTYEATLRTNNLGDDFVLGRGRVYGDFMETGTTGVAALPISTFDKKTLLDCIGVVREIIGFNFFVDEGGGIVWCAPNLFALGNFVRNPAIYGGARTNSMVLLHEGMNLISLGSTISSGNVRERVFVASTDGTTGALVEGYNPNPTGLRRVSGWTDQHFQSAIECQTMAELIALRQLFTYRKDTAQIPGYPAIQVDDQIRIVESVTGEEFVHYVSGIQSSLDMESGEYYYTLTTNWLGQDPSSFWVFDPNLLSPAVQDYLNAIWHGIQFSDQQATTGTGDASVGTATT